MAEAGHWEAPGGTAVPPEQLKGRGRLHCICEAERAYVLLEVWLQDEREVPGHEALSC